MVDAKFPVVLARKSVQCFLANGQRMPLPEHIPDEYQRSAGVFVSLKKQGNLRGCIGTFQAVQPTIAAEIIQNAISAATEDPRFAPVNQSELSSLTISVDILEQPEQILDIAQLDPARYGVIVHSGHRRGLLLPMLEGVDTVEDQIGIAMQKAGIRQGEPIELYRFTVTRYQE